MPLMSYKKGYHFLHERILDASVGTLAAGTVAVLGSKPYDGMDQSFLAKKGNFDLAAKITDTNGSEVISSMHSVLIGLAQGNLSTTEIGEAISAALSLPEDPAEAVDFAKVDNWIVNKSIALLHPDTFASDWTNNNLATISARHSFELGKGILFSENVGFQWFIYNMSGSAWAVTMNVSGLVTVEGVFLND